MPDRLGRSLRFALLAGPLLLVLSGCDIVQQKLGIESPSTKAAKADTEGRAVGGACRQSGRAIEDCYSIYQWLPKAAIYDGWREMDGYMRENKLETIEPQLPPPPPPPVPGAKKKTTPAAAKEEPAAKAADKH